MGESSMPDEERTSAHPNLNGGSAGSSQFTLPWLSRSAAEKALAKLWLCLEEHGLRTPDLGVELEVNDCVRLTVTMADPKQAATLFDACAEEWFRLVQE